MRSQNSAALASSIFLVCRKRQADAGVGYADEVRATIRANVRERLDAFWAAGLRGADFFISAIGPATAAFSRYTRVETLGGTAITVSQLLEWVQEEVADYALRRVFGGDAATATSDSDADAGLGDEVDAVTRFYVLWRWTYDAASLGKIAKATVAAVSATSDADTDAEPDPGADGDDEDAGGGGKAKVKKIPFGDAHLMAIALGADIARLVAPGGLLAGRSDVTLVEPRERLAANPALGAWRVDHSTPLIDVLHRAELLWSAGNPQALADFLDEALPGEREPFRRVAQALIDLLPRGDAEKQRLEGLLGNLPEGGTGGSGGGGSGTRPPAATQTGFGEIGQADVRIRQAKRSGTR